MTTIQPFKVNLIRGQGESFSTIKARLKSPSQKSTFQHLGAK